MSQLLLPASVFDFMRQLKQNNNREWFAQNKEAYQLQLEYVETFTEGLLNLVNTHDVIETPTAKKALHRIYRDIRFSKDKTPFKSNWSGGFKRAGKHRRGGYYFHLEPGNTFIGGGFWAPNTPDLKRIRDDIAFDPSPLKQIINSKEFKTVFGVLEGEQLKTTPKGYAADDDAIELLRYKQFLVRRRFTDAEALSPDFVKQASDTFKSMRPFFDYMSDVLTANLNGEED
ncbi:DUF2461 domain-containing protein [Mucilaginibacter kameinonensis]|uniref:DUF2461 domain-containing protein n=1 Tax=Mucilaginibacter kameinonensis TaxID=452286 RepID=UPI000EF84FC5|nr:DUF2461 domain-containing protein [Mucilaginibacter kameinonensis]